MRVSLVVLLLLGADLIGITHRAKATQSAAQNAEPETVPTQQAIATPAIPTEPRALYEALTALRPDAARVYSVKDLTIRRDVVSFTLTEGKLAFLEPLGGRITGAFFSGRGHVIATPHERGERRSLAHFIGVPILETQPQSCSANLQQTACSPRAIRISSRTGPRWRQDSRRRIRCAPWWIGWLPSLFPIFTFCCKPIPRER
jgi:hypothetical protein